MGVFFFLIILFVVCGLFVHYNSISGLFAELELFVQILTRSAQCSARASSAANGIKNSNKIIPFLRLISSANSCTEKKSLNIKICLFLYYKSTVLPPHELVSGSIAVNMGWGATSSPWIDFRQILFLAWVCWLCCLLPAATVRLPEQLYGPSGKSHKFVHSNCECTRMYLYVYMQIVNVGCYVLWVWVCVDYYIERTVYGDAKMYRAENSHIWCCHVPGST